jgi:hypothetical protein
MKLVPEIPAPTPRDAAAALAAIDAGKITSVAISVMRMKVRSEGLRPTHRDQHRTEDGNNGNSHRLSPRRGIYNLRFMCRALNPSKAFHKLMKKVDAGRAISAAASIADWDK